MNVIVCKECGAPTVGRCKACGMPMCKNHLIHDDPFHSSGFMRKPADYCKACYRRKQGASSAILLLVMIVALGCFVAFMILGWE